MGRFTKKLNLIITIALLAGFFLSLAPSLSPVSAQGEWVIEGSKVYIEDENIYLSASPHTIVGSSWVEFELLSKRYEGDIDVVWGFDVNSGAIPKNPQIWADNVPHQKWRWIEVERNDEITVDNITAYELLAWNGIEPDIGNYNNSKLIRLTVVEGTGEYSIVIAFNSYIQHTELSATFYYTYFAQEKEYYIEYYPDFKPFNTAGFTKSIHDYQGVDTWYFTKLDTPITRNILYRVRVWIDVPFSGLVKFSSKYIWAVKPSGESISEARARGHLYLLDPWLSGGWDQRVKLTIDQNDIDAPLSNFPVLVYLSTSSGRNNDDVSFIFDELGSDANRRKIAVTTSDGETELYVEIEKWDDANEQAWLWVKVPAIASDADTDLYLYFDSSHADNDSYVGDTNSTPAENVWVSHFKFVSHMRDDPDSSYIRDSTSNDADGTKLAAGHPAISASGQIDGAQNYGGDDDIDIGTSFNYEKDVPWSLSGWFKTSSATYQFIFSNMTAGEPYRGYMILIMNDGQINVQLINNNATGDVIEVETNAIGFADGVQHKIVVTYDGSGDASGLTIYIDGAVEASSILRDALTATIVSAIGMHLGSREASEVFLTGLLDESRIDDTELTLPWVHATYESERDNLIAFGSEELEPPTVVTDNATSIEETTATLSGNIIDIGGENVDWRGFEWDIDSGPPYADNWTEGGSFGIGGYTQGITGLTKGELYYYRAIAHNSGGTGNGSEITFLTKPDEPNTLVATSGDEQVSLTWVKGTGAQNTIIRGKIGSYPANYDTDTAVYNGSGTGTTHSGLTNGDHWYYRAWSYATEGGKEQYSDTYDQADAIPVGDPTVTNDGGATNITDTAARLRGELTDNGGENPTVHIYWGLTDESDNATAWDNDENLGALGVGTFYTDISTLSENTTYFYRSYAINSGGSDWANSTENFTTLGGLPGAPTGFFLTYISDYEVGIDWTKGTSANSTMIRRIVGRYPTDRNDGELVYYSTGDSTIDYDVNLDTTGDFYYYRAWSENTTGVWSLEYAEAKIKGGGMTLIALILFLGVLSFLSLKNIGVLLSVAASGAWLAVMSYIAAYPPGNMAKGETPHQMLILVFLGVAAALLISGVVRSRRSREDTSGYEGEGYAPPSGKETSHITGESVRQSRSSRHGWGSEFAESPEEYQARIHKILHPRHRRR